MGVSSEGQMHLNFFFRMFVATDQAMLIAALTFTVTPTTVHCASHVCISWVVLFGGGGVGGGSLPKCNYMHVFWT